MIVVSGALYVEEANRDSYLEGCIQVIAAARKSEGCLDFYLVADPVEPGRINVFEKWETIEDVNSFRGSGPSSDQMAAILDARAFQHEVASTTKL